MSKTQRNRRNIRFFAKKFGVKVLGVIGENSVESKALIKRLAREQSIYYLIPDQECFRNGRNYGTFTVVAAAVPEGYQVVPKTVVLAADGSSGSHQKEQKGGIYSLLGNDRIVIAVESRKEGKHHDFTQDINDLFESGYWPLLQNSLGVWKRFPRTSQAAAIMAKICQDDDLPPFRRYRDSGQCLKTCIDRYKKGKR